MIAAMKGVLVFSLIVAKKLNNSPSLAMEYKIRGIGNKQPINLQNKRHKDDDNPSHLL